MPRKKRHKRKCYSARQAVIGHSEYATKGTLRQARSVSKSGEVQASKDAMLKGAKMAEIEAYAKKNGLTLSQAMIHFM